MTPDELEVDQTLILRDQNENRMGGPKVGTVTKVGRKLVTIAPEQGWWTTTYRIDTQRVNDERGHGWFQTPDQYAEDVLRVEVMGALRGGLGVNTNFGNKLSNDQLIRILAIVQEGIR